MIFFKQLKRGITHVCLGAFLACALHAQEAIVRAASDEESATQAKTKADAPPVPPADIAEQADAAVGQETADEGIQIQVEKFTGSTGSSHEAGSVKVYSPWPAKPLAKAPDGWKYVPAPAEIEPYKQSVKLSAGKTLDLSITPFVLEPVSDGASTIRIEEPGFDPALQYAQQSTVGAMLRKSTADLEENEKHAAKAISLMQQLLSSLPHKKQ